LKKKILTTAESPFLLKSICTWQDSQLAWLALEYCPGGDLREFLEVINCFEEQEATLYFAEMIMGVHDLHKMGYIHRDLKPPNFLIDKTGHIKLADFGLAKPKHKIGKLKTEEEETAPQQLTAAELESRKQHIWKRQTVFGLRATLSPDNFHTLFIINNSMKREGFYPREKLAKPHVTIKVPTIPEKKRTAS